MMRYLRLRWLCVLMILPIIAGCQSSHHSQADISFMEPHQLNQKSKYFADINKTDLVSAFFLRYQLKENRIVEVKLKKLKSDGTWEDLMRLSLGEEGGQRGIITVYSDPVSGLQILNIAGAKATSSHKAINPAFKNTAGSKRAFTAVEQLVPLIPGKATTFMVMTQSKQSGYMTVPFPGDIKDGFKAKEWGADNIYIWTIEAK